MPNHAQVTLVGHLGHDPSTKQTPGGESVTEFSIATARKRKDSETTTWWRCAMWGKRGETIARYLHKGDPILVTGEPCMRPWTDKDGAQRQSLDVEVRDFAFVGGKGEQQAAPQPAPMSGGACADADADIPFLAYERGWIA